MFALSQKLYTYPNNKNAFKALIAAEINKVKIELPQFEFGVTNKTDKFVKLNPFAKASAGCLAFIRVFWFRRPSVSPSAGTLGCQLLLLAILKRRLSPGSASASQVPTLETPEGGIFESNAIARYVARLGDNGLFGASPVEAVRK